MPQKRNAQCRFCLENDRVCNLVAPCLCKGTSKFIHNDCLMRWYIEKPDKGLVCGTCKIPYARLQLSEMEDLQILQVLLQEYRAFFPFSQILTQHAVFYSVVFAFYPWYVINPLRWYVGFQGFLHAIYFFGLWQLIQQVKNRRQYLECWKDPFRMVLIGLHLFFIGTMLKTHALGGISANLCMHLYYFEHFEIVHAINKDHAFVFVSRSTGLRRLPS